MRVNLANISLAMKQQSDKWVKRPKRIFVLLQKNVMSSILVSCMRMNPCKFFIVIWMKYISFWQGSEFGLLLNRFPCNLTSSLSYHLNQKNKCLKTLNIFSRKTAYFCEIPKNNINVMVFQNLHFKLLIFSFQFATVAK